ncbi:DUF6950 family protein [Yoonia sp. 208BN28-4]|uniref:DUF6950 family protein n=1 Tax=Yoonia sp. 208BN28-4 TaxID=3126505 RepID=UPI0030B36349
MQRFPDWQARLKAYIKAQAGVPFQFGKLDGAMFAAGCIEAMTGVDLARGYRGYRTAAGGIRKCRAKGHDSLVGPFAHLPEIAPLAAQAGDLVVLDGPDGLCMGVAQGAFIMGVDRQQGVGPLSNPVIVRAFKVGS